MSEPRKITLWFRQHKVHRWFRVWHWAGDDLDCRCGHGWELHDAEAIPPLCMVCGDMVRCHARSAAGAETGGLAERVAALADEKEAMFCRSMCGPDAHRDDPDGCELLLIGPAELRALLAQPAPSESSERDPWAGQNPLGCCQDNRTEGGVLTHGGPDCKWPGEGSTRPAAGGDPTAWVDYRDALGLRPTEGVSG